MEYLTLLVCPVETALFCITTPQEGMCLPCCHPWAGSLLLCWIVQHQAPFQSWLITCSLEWMQRLCVLEKLWISVCPLCTVVQGEGLSLGRSTADTNSGREGAWTLEHPTLRSLAVLPGLISPGSWAACQWVGNIALLFQMLYKTLNPGVGWCFSFHCRCCFWEWWKRRPVRC